MSSRVNKMAIDTDDLGLFISFFLLASIAIIGNGLVLYHITHVFETFSTITTRLIFSLHLAAIFEGITSLPYIFVNVPSLCQLMGALHYYFGLVIIGIDLSLTLLFYNFLIWNNSSIERNLSRYGIPLLLVFALITFLPFTTDSYGTNGEVWCTLNYYDSMSNIWSFCVFYLESAVAFIICSIALGYLLYFIRKYDMSVQKSILMSAGSYVLITLVALGPRLIPRMLNLFFILPINEIAEFFVQGSIYLASILYIICFFWNAETLRKYEFSRANESLSRHLLHISSELIDSLDHDRARSLSETDKGLLLEEQNPLRLNSQL